jgi:hypothetical protein
MKKQTERWNDPDTMYIIKAVVKNEINTLKLIKETSKRSLISFIVLIFHNIALFYSCVNS